LLAILAKNIAIAIAIFGRKNIAILIAILYSSQYCNTVAILSAIFHYPLPRRNFDFHRCVQFF